MKPWLLLFLTAALAPLVHADPPPPAGKSVRPFFDGKTLAGWEGDAKLWRVQDGCIVGGPQGEDLKHNDFLATTGDYGNFIVRMKIKLTGTGFVNSGFQIRSQRVPKNTEMAGYQCDCGDPTWWGCVYDESRRNKVMAQSDMKALDSVIKRNDWNEYVIRADGPRITTWINGVTGVDYVEQDPKIPLSGKMGIQVHGGGRPLVEVKELTIEELPPTKVIKGAGDPPKAPQPSPQLPQDEKASFSVPPGFEVELVVSEDMEKGYGKFVAVNFDQKGRLWTMTALEYPVDANENPGAADALYASKAKDKVLVYPIEDRGTNGQPPRYGKEPTVFADGLAIPLGILPYKDGCYVQHGHDLELRHDTDGDGRADKTDVVLTGFGVQDSHLFPHQFTRAPGGYLWLAQGAFNYSNVATPEGKTVKFDQTRMARFRPDGSQFEITSNGPCNIWGLAMNGVGESFIQEANDFGYPVMPFHEYGNYPGCSNSQWKSYAPEFPGTAPFRMGGTGLSGLALTDASGAYPEDWADVMLVANPIINKIQAIKMHRDSTRAGGWRLEQRPDFVTTSDPWFRPVAMTLGPDGCVYIVDWYNKIISHNEVPRNHPERDKKRGRIWRVKHKDQKCFPVPDFTTAPEKDLVAKLGGASVAQSHLAWQALVDRKELAKETVQSLLGLLAAAPAPAGVANPEAAAVQALWVLSGAAGTQSGLRSAGVDLAGAQSPHLRRQAAALLATLPPAEASPALAKLLSDKNPDVRAAAIQALGLNLKLPGTLAALLSIDLAPIAEPVAPSTQSGKPIKVGAAYDREFQRYLVRLFLEREPQAVAAFLDSPEAAKAQPESLMVACLSLPAKDSAPRVAKLLPQLKRTPNDEEILRLAEAVDAPGVKEALAALVGTPDGLAALLRQKTRFDARALAPLVAGTAKKLLAENPEAGLKVVAAFKLADLEPDVAAILPKAPAAALPVLRDLGSTRADLFLPLVQSADPAVRALALTCLASTPDKLLPLWPSLNAAQRSSALSSLSGTPAGAHALVAAIAAGTVAKDDLDGPLVEKLQAVLPGDAALKTLVDSMAGLFKDVLVLNGDNNAFADTDLTLDGAFTVETWIKLDKGIGNEDGLLGAPGVLDINFYDSHLRVWAGGLNDIIVAKKATAPDAWTHVCVTRDAAGAFRIYLNGELDQADGRPDPRKYEHLAIGRTNVPKGTAAALAEYRIWSVCRTPEQVRADFDRTYDGKPAGLVFYQPLDSRWEKLKAPARMTKTPDFPNVITPAAAKALDEKFAKFRALAGKPGGDPARGKIAGAVCMACHKFGAEGGLIGPNLSAVGAMGQEAILRNILTPNAAMEPGYRIFRAELADGSIKEGFLASQDDKAIVIRLPGAEDQRYPLDQVRKSGFTKRSMMPEGLEATYTPEQWTDLFAWLNGLK